jgi:hypothetical protein
MRCLTLTLLALISFGASAFAAPFGYVILQNDITGQHQYGAGFGKYNTYQEAYNAGNAKAGEMNMILYRNHQTGTSYTFNVIDYGAGR